MKKLFAALIICSMLAITVSAGSLSADDVRTEETMRVKNVYSCEFISLGTLPSYEQGSNFFFVKGSENHEEFLKYINLESDKPLVLLEDDFPVVQKDDVVVAYMFSSEEYGTGYESIIEFYNFEGTINEGYLQLRYTLTAGMDTVHHFFVRGTTAVIRWKTVPSTLTVYFGGENISRTATLEDGFYEAEVIIERNGAYPIWFANDYTDALTGTITYSISGFESSGSGGIAIVTLIIAAAGIVLLIYVYPRPKWSKSAGTKGTGPAYEDADSEEADVRGEGCDEIYEDTGEEVHEDREEYEKDGEGEAYGDRAEREAERDD